MRIEMQDDELEPLPAELRAAFRDYPRPSASRGFDARFWSELDARKRRYRGFSGFMRRLIEVEIEGIAVWRLGFSLFSGAAVCALGIGILSLSSSSPRTVDEVPRVAKSNEVPTSAPRFAREVWDDFGPRSLPPLKRHIEKKKEVSSCVSFVHGWA